MSHHHTLTHKKRSFLWRGGKGRPSYVLWPGSVCARVLRGSLYEKDRARKRLTVREKKVPFFPERIEEEKEVCIYVPKKSSSLLSSFGGGLFPFAAPRREGVSLLPKSTLGNRMGKKEESSLGPTPLLLLQPSLPHQRSTDVRRRRKASPSPAVKGGRKEDGSTITLSSFLPR